MLTCNVFCLIMHVIMDYTSTQQQYSVIKDSNDNI